MGGKSGGGYDAGPSIEYGNKALALQEKMYGDSIERTQPYYDVGTSGLNMLADLLGINGGSVKSRDTVYNELKDDYTTRTAGTMPVYGVPWELRNFDFEGWQNQNPNSNVSYAQSNGINVTRADATNEQLAEDLMNLKDTNREAFNTIMSNFGKGGSPAYQETVDFDGLNAAVDEMMASQQTPDNYGSLLKSFTMDDFQADPGYQFRLDEGNKAIERAAAARGGYFDPSTMKALTDYNANTADLTYNDAYNRFNNDQSNIFNRLAAIAGIGQTSNNSLNAVSANNANAAGNIYGQMGSAAQAAQNANDSQPSMFDTLMGMGMQLGSAYLGNPRAFA